MENNDNILLVDIINIINECLIAIVDKADIKNEELVNTLKANVSKLSGLATTIRFSYMAKEMESLPCSLGCDCKGECNKEPS